MAYIVKQIANLVNDAVKDAIGKTEEIVNLDTTDLVSLGKQIDKFDAYEGFYKSLVNRLVKTVYFVRTYEGSRRSVLRDEHEFGAFVQKVYYEMPEAVSNPTWDIPHEDTYGQASPYDVEGTIAVSSITFGGKGTWSIEIIRPVEQIKTAFLDNASMIRFIDGIYVTIENAFKLQEERITALAVNTSMALSLSKGVSRNLLKEYNDNHADATIVSIEEALESPSFLKYASMEINRTIDNIATMSTVYNTDGYNTFTSKENVVVEMLSHFASASDMYLQADTFHNELTKLPNFEKIAYWQGSGKDFKLADCSSIDVKHNDLIVEDTNPTGTVKQSGIICFVHDVENVACYFGNRRTWEIFNPRSEVMIHGEKAEKGYAVDSHANAVVFYMATE